MSALSDAVIMREQRERGTVARDCPRCGAGEPWECRSPGRLYFKCWRCRRKFSISSGTLAHSHKIPVGDVYEIASELLRGEPAVAISLRLRVNPSTVRRISKRLNPDTRSPSFNRAEGSNTEGERLL